MAALKMAQQVTELAARAGPLSLLFVTYKHRQKERNNPIHVFSGLHMCATVCTYHDPPPTHIIRTQK